MKRGRGLVFEWKCLLLSKCLYGIYGHVPIFSGWRDHFWQLLVTIGSGDLDAININMKGSLFINIIIELSNGVYSHVPILGGVEGPFLAALGYYW